MIELNLCATCGKLDPFGLPEGEDPGRLRMHHCISDEKQYLPKPEWCCTSCRRVESGEGWTHTCPRIMPDGTMYVYPNYDGEWVREIDGKEDWTWLISPYFGRDRWGHPQHDPHFLESEFYAPTSDTRSEDLDEPRWIVGWWVTYGGYFEPPESDIEYDEVFDTFEAAHEFARDKYARQQIEEAEAQKAMQADWERWDKMAKEDVNAKPG